MIELVLSAFLLGLLFNAIPGSIFAESLRRGLTGGFQPALALQVGSLAGDLVWASLGLAGAAALFSLPYVEMPLALAGAILLGWIAWQALRDGLSPMPTFGSTSGRAKQSALVTGAALSLSNPMNITYWAGLGGTISALGVSNPGPMEVALFLVGFMSAAILWCFICAGAIAWSRRFVGPRLWMWSNLACATGLGAFSLLVLWRTAFGR